MPDIKSFLKSIKDSKIRNTGKDIKTFVASRKKAIGAGYKTTTTTLPEPGHGGFLSFLAIAAEEDGSSKRIIIRNPYIQNSWVFSATRTMAENLAQVPFLITDTNDNIVEVSSIKYGWTPRLFDYVSPYMNKFSLFESIPIWLSLRGECFWRLVRSDIGNQPVRIEVLMPENMTEIIKNEELVAWEEWRDGIKTIHDTEDIIQFKYFNPYNPWRGLSPLVAALLGLNIDFASSAYNYYFFNNDSTPAGLLSSDQDLEEEEVDASRKQWNKNQKGISKKGRIAILGSGFKYQQISMAQKDIQYIEQKKWSRAEVFAVLGVSPAMVGVLEDSSIKANVKEQKAQLFENNLIPKMHLIEAVLKTEFFDRLKLPLKGHFDIKSISAMEESFKEILEQAERLQKLGFTTNEINERLQLGFGTKPWRDSWWIPFNNVPAGEEPPAKKEEKALIEYIEKRAHPHRDLVWKSLIRQTENIEEAFAKELREYFYKMRQDVLNNILGRKSAETMTIIEKAISSWTTKALGEELLFNADEYNRMLDGISRKHLTEAYEAGIASLKGTLGTTYDMTFVRAVSSLSKRVTAIVGINETVRTQLLEVYKPVLERGLREGLSYDQMASELVGLTRKKFNNARSRSKTIARTETNGAMNQARQDTMIESGITKQEWVSSMDVSVRPSHAAADGEVRAIDELFSNGLQYPHDPSGPAAEVINCRCVIIPVIDEAEE